MQLSDIVLSAVPQERYLTLRAQWYDNQPKRFLHEISFAEIVASPVFDSFQTLIEEFLASGYAYRVNYFQRTPIDNKPAGFRAYRLTELIVEGDHKRLQCKKTIPKTTLWRIATEAEQDGLAGYLELYARPYGMFPTNGESEARAYWLSRLYATRIDKGVIIFNVQMNDNLFDAFSWEQEPLEQRTRTRRYFSLLENPRGLPIIPPS